MHHGGGGGGGGGDDDGGGGWKVPRLAAALALAAVMVAVGWAFWPSYVTSCNHDRNSRENHWQTQAGKGPFF